MQARPVIALSASVSDGILTDATPNKPDHAIDLAPGVWLAPADAQFRFVRSGGPGGQSVNKTATKAELRVAVGDIIGLDAHARRRLRRAAGQRLTKDDVLVIQSEQHRTQRDNRRACLERLAELVQRAATRPKKRKPTRPSRSAVEKRIKEKKQTGEKKRQRRTGRMKPGDIEND